MHASKKWVLLANAYYDRSQLGNATAFEIARLTDFSWVPSGCFVEVLLNGEHQGLYYLCEKIDIGNGKIEIDELKTTDSDDYTISGGYLLESGIAYFTEENSFATSWFNKTGRDLAWPFGWFLKSPKSDIPNAHLNYVQSCLNNMEELIYNDELLLGGGYLNYLDIDSAINWWFVKELAVDDEAGYTQNVYLYKKRGDEKFYVGPPWDCDACTFWLPRTQKFYAKETGFYYRQLFKDPFFVNRVKEKWDSYKSDFEQRIPIFIDEQFKIIYRAAIRNENLWPDWYWVFYYPEKSYDKIVEEMKKAFLIQFEYMDKQIRQM